jgi:xanthine dehydrogenase molybdopterin-binding subunit B
MDYEKGIGNPFDYFSYGVVCSEVEIDCLTGDHQVSLIKICSISHIIRVFI